MPQRLFEMIAPLEGRFPNIQLDKEMVAELKAGDPDPMFVTLPIMPIGATSRNGRTYNRASVESIVRQINDKRVEGVKGHLKNEDRPYVWEAAPVRWLKATIDEQSGMAWGKLYVLPSFPTVRDHFRVAKATRAKVGTSIYGTAEIDEEGNVNPETLNIESIDLAHPDRLGVLEAGEVPTVTSETLNEEEAEGASLADPKQHEEINETNEEHDTMPEETKLITELRADNDRLNNRVQELELLEQANHTLQRDLKAVRRLLGISETANITAEIHRLHTTIEDQQTRLLQLTGVAITEAVNNALDVEEARVYVAEQLGLHLMAQGYAVPGNEDIAEMEGRETPSADVIQRALESVMNRATVKAHIQSVAETALGPNITESNHNPNKGKQTTSESKLDEFFPTVSE